MVPTPACGSLSTLSGQSALVMSRNRHSPTDGTRRAGPSLPRRCTRGLRFRTNSWSTASGGISTTWSVFALAPGTPTPCAFPGPWERRIGRSSPAHWRRGRRISTPTELSLTATATRRNTSISGRSPRPRLGSSLSDAKSCGLHTMMWLVMATWMKREAAIAVGDSLGGVEGVLDD